MSEKEGPHRRPGIRTRDLVALACVIIAAASALAMTIVKLNL
ncbi:MAG: hypothetical protein ACTHKM_08615 [Tsuneonella sp.]